MAFFTAVVSVIIAFVMRYANGACCICGLSAVGTCVQSLAPADRVFMEGTHFDGEPFTCGSSRIYDWGDGPCGYAQTNAWKPGDAGCECAEDTRDAKSTPACSTCTADMIRDNAPFHRFSVGALSCTDAYTFAASGFVGEVACDQLKIEMVDFGCCGSLEDFTPAPTTTTPAPTGAPGTCVVMAGSAGMDGYWVKQATSFNGQSVYKNGRYYLFATSDSGDWAIRDKLSTSGGARYYELEICNAELVGDCGNSWGGVSFCSALSESCVRIQRSNGAKGTFDGDWIEQGTFNEKPYYKNGRYYLFATSAVRGWAIRSRLSTSGGARYYDISCSWGEVVTDCGDDWGHVTEDVPCSQALDAETVDESCYDETSSLCVYNNLTLFDGDRWFERHGCHNGEPVYYLQNEIGVNVDFYLFYDQANASVAARWIIARAEISNEEPLAFCYEDNVLNCLESKWSVWSSNVSGEMSEDNMTLYEGYCDGMIAAESAADHGMNLSVVAAVVAIVAIVCAIVIVGGCYMMRRRKKHVEVSFDDEEAAGGATSVATEDVAMIEVQH